MFSTLTLHRIASSGLKCGVIQIDIRSSSLEDLSQNGGLQCPFPPSQATMSQPSSERRASNEQVHSQGLPQFTPEIESRECDAAIGNSRLLVQDE